MRPSGRGPILPFGEARCLWEQVGLWFKLDFLESNLRVPVRKPHIWEATESQL